MIPQVIVDMDTYGTAEISSRKTTNGDVDNKRAHGEDTNNNNREKTKRDKHDDDED